MEGKVKMYLSLQLTDCGNEELEGFLRFTGSVQRSRTILATYQGIFFPFRTSPQRVNPTLDVAFFFGTEVLLNEMYRSQHFIQNIKLYELSNGPPNRKDTPRYKIPMNVLRPTLSLPGREGLDLARTHIETIKARIVNEELKKYEYNLAIGDQVGQLNQLINDFPHELKARVIEKGGVLYSARLTR